MNKKTLSEIDFYRIRDEVASLCLSQEGRNAFLEREPLTEAGKIEELKNLSREWTSFFSALHASPISSWEPIAGLNAIIHTNGAALSLEQVAALGQFVLSVKKVRQAVELNQTELQLKFLPEKTALLPDFSETEKKIFRVITSDGELRDLPEIAAIRREIASLNSKLKTIMQGFTSNQKLSGVLESSLPVLRNGRQVLAVKASQQNKIPGIIHEVSQSAQTVYVEPEAAVRCSNELVQKESELLQVIKEILTELTLSLQSSIPLFKAALPLMCLLDGTSAAARWGIEHNCVFPLFAKEEPPLLLKARHPLLGEKAVPIDIRFMDGKRLLIITGPNTGGKTVTLKTFALFAMLNQTGIPLPCAEGSRLPVFSNVFADIGDSQSLDMSLSTFSGHMKNIAEAVEGADSNSLILLDELGSGTDPQEGTAIAMSVLDNLIEKKSFVLVTTHMGVLKNYGYTNPSCVNASVEFNADTLSPSYRLLMGVPGESHALDIAKKSGLAAGIVEKAKGYIAAEQADVSSLIRGLNKKHIELDKIIEETNRQNKELLEKYDRLKEKELGLRRKENELKKGHQQEMHDFLVHSRRQLENLVRQIREGELTKEKTVGVKTFIADLTEDVDRLDQKIEREEEKLANAQKEFEAELKKRKHPASNKKTKKKLSNAEALKYATSFADSEEENPSAGKKSAGKTFTGTSFTEKKLSFEAGAAVKSISSGVEGLLVESTKKGVWTVQFGSVRMTMKEKDLQLLQKNDNSSYKPSVLVDLTNSSIEKEAARPVFELRLIGMRLEEAIHSLERQIDLCALHNFFRFSVIHGKGDGILQQAVHDYLSHCPIVKEFSFAPADDGGTGKTYVLLDGE
ncbi:MAG: Smr/MutS family protein [Treponema sp.]|nr:Smr/MutS family protein [Treponema sp.]